LSGWIGKVDSQGQPRNAVTVIYIFAAILLCSIIPSQVAFTSLVSAGAVPTIAAYGLIAVLRLTMTPDHFKSSHFGLGKYSKLFYICAALFNGLVFAVSRFSHSNKHSAKLVLGRYITFRIPRQCCDVQFRESCSCLDQLIPLTTLLSPS